MGSMRLSVLRNDDYNDIYGTFVEKLSGLISAANEGVVAAPTKPQCCSSKQSPPFYQVGKALMAIVQRIRLADARALVTGLERCWQEQSNGNAGSQNRASDDLDMLTQEIAGRMVASDRQYVENLLASFLPQKSS